jgi:hypothetical protein
MYKEVLSGIQDISIYPVFSFVVFFTFFITLSVWLIRSKKKDFEEISRMPLAENKMHTPSNE